MYLSEPKPKAPRKPKKIKSAFGDSDDDDDDIFGKKTKKRAKKSSDDEDFMPKKPKSVAAKKVGTIVNVLSITWMSHSGG